MKLTPKQALDILKLVPEENTFGSGPAGRNIDGGQNTAWDIMTDEKGRMKIGTSCKELDDVLGGGVSSKEITELTGVPGVGKTQLGMQLSINVQIPQEFGGLGGHAVYIDTEGSFMVERAIQMAEACVEEIKNRAPTDPQVDGAPIKAELDVDTILSQIYYFRVHSAAEQLAVISRMDRFLEDHKLVRLIVVDSIAFQFRQGFSTMRERTRILCTMTQSLVNLSSEHQIAIVAINQVTQKISEDGSTLLPALGETWGHATTNRVTMYWGDDGKRHAFLLKSPNLPRQGACFLVSKGGIQSDKGDEEPSRDACYVDLMGGIGTDGVEGEPAPIIPKVSRWAGESSAKDKLPSPVPRTCLFRCATEIDPIDEQPSPGVPAFVVKSEQVDREDKLPAPGATESVFIRGEPTVVKDEQSQPEGFAIPEGVVQTDALDKLPSPGNSSSIPIDVIHSDAEDKLPSVGYSSSVPKSIVQTDAEEKLPSPGNSSSVSKCFLQTDLADEKPPSTGDSSSSPKRSIQTDAGDKPLSSGTSSSVPESMTETDVRDKPSSPVSSASNSRIVVETETEVPPSAGAPDVVSEDQPPSPGASAVRPEDEGVSEGEDKPPSPERTEPRRVLVSSPPTSPAP